MSTANPLSWSDIDAWARLTGTKPRKWELEAISGIDGAFRASTTQE